MSINFNNTTTYNETECFLSRQATLTVDGEEYCVDYLVIINMDENSATVPTITEVEIEAIPDLDDYTYASGLTEAEAERRMDKRDHILNEVQTILNEYYKVEGAP